MPIDFDSETIEITSKLIQAEGYLNCEKIIVQNIKKQLENGNNDENIILYLNKLSAWFEGKIAGSHVREGHINYRYAAGFVVTLLKMPYWKSWMKTIDTPQ